MCNRLVAYTPPPILCTESLCFQRVTAKDRRKLFCGLKLAVDYSQKRAYRSSMADSIAICNNLRIGRPVLKKRSRCGPRVWVDERKIPPLLACIFFTPTNPIVLPKTEITRKVRELTIQLNGMALSSLVWIPGIDSSREWIGSSPLGGLVVDRQLISVRRFRRRRYVESTRFYRRGIRTRPGILGLLIDKSC